MSSSYFSPHIHILQSLPPPFFPTLLLSLSLIHRVNAHTGHTDGWKSKLLIATLGIARVWGRIDREISSHTCVFVSLYPRASSLVTLSWPSQRQVQDGWQDACQVLQNNRRLIKKDNKDENFILEYIVSICWKEIESDRRGQAVIDQSHAGNMPCIFL